MYDLKGVIAVIAAYPVHLMTFVGCVLLFWLVLPRRRRWRRERRFQLNLLLKRKGWRSKKRKFLLEKLGVLAPRISKKFRRRR